MDGQAEAVMEGFLWLEGLAFYLRSQISTRGCILRIQCFYCSAFIPEEKEINNPNKHVFWGVWTISHQQTSSFNGKHPDSLMDAGRGGCRHVLVFKISRRYFTAPLKRGLKLKMRLCSYQAHRIFSLLSRSGKKIERTCNVCWYYRPPIYLISFQWRKWWIRVESALGLQWNTHTFPKKRAERRFRLGCFQLLRLPDARTSLAVRVIHWENQMWPVPDKRTGK